MDYDQLKKFVLEEMRMEDDHNYQPVMIRTLLQNHCKATKNEIMKELHEANREQPIEYFQNSSVFDVLTTNHPVAKFNDAEHVFELLDSNVYENAKALKAAIVRYCNQRIEKPHGVKLNVEEIISEFREWFQTEEAEKHKQLIQKEKKEVTELLSKLDLLDKSSNEFTDLVLYGLLPYFKTQYAKRFSTFPVFYNIKSFLKNYNYDEKDWSQIANMIYTLASNFSKNPEKLEQWITEFTANKKYIRMIQVASITPILFSINDSVPVINNRVRRTYKELSYYFGWNDKMSRKIENYPETIKKCRRLIDELRIEELKDLGNFDLFCYWYDYLREREEIDEPEEEETTDLGGEFENVDFAQFLQTVDLANTSKFDPHSLPNPERIKIKEIIQNCEKGKWLLPNFQRYFDWKKTDIRDLLESIFHDYYIGSLLLWKSDKDPPLKTIPIHGIKLNGDGENLERIILDGQQRITSMYYAIKAHGMATNKIKTPRYYYINFKKYFDDNDSQEIIEIRREKSPWDVTIKKMRFPLYELENWNKWIDDFEDSIGSPTSSDYQKVKAVRRVMEKKLRHFIDGFEIPYITLPETMELDQVTDIFERINTKGKLLSVFDLLVARLSKFEIELKELWEKSVKSYPKLKVYNSSDKIPIYILQAICLYYNKASSCKRKDVLNTYNSIFESSDLDFEETWEEMSQFLDSAINKMENLRDGFGVKDRTTLPFLAMIPILGALMKEIDSRQDKVDCLSKLQTWYWSSVFGEGYSGAVDSQLTADFREMKRWFEDNNSVPRIIERVRRELYATLNLREIKSKSSAIYKGVLSLLALEGAPDFETGLTLENARGNDLHHIFPKKRFDSSKIINSILNMTWLSDETNRRISAKYPSKYIQEFIDTKFKDKDEFFKVLKQHFINEKAFEHMLKDDFEAFASEREKIIFTKISELIGIKETEKQKTLLSPEAPFDNEIIIEETFKKCDEYVHWPDKYFRTKGLKWLRNYLQKDKVKEIKILTSIDTVTEELRDLFKAFRKQMSSDEISCEMRVITDNKLKGQIHGRWLITKDDCFTFQSVDTVSRGAYDEIRGGAARPPFDEWWKNSFDIIDEWEKIKKF